MGLHRGFASYDAGVNRFGNNLSHALIGGPSLVFDN